jgi:hypothetical protein
MTYRFVLTAEKSGSNVVAAIEVCSYWQEVAACWPDDSPFAAIEKNVSEDLSYVEWTAVFPDREVYELWHEAYSSVHDENRELVFAEFESQGGTINLYNEGIDLSSPNRSRPIEEFVSRFLP